MSDDLKQLLASVARECVETAPDDMGDVLERRLLPLLEAGQAHFDEHHICIEEDCTGSCPKATPCCDQDICTCGKDAWDAALAAAKERQT